MPSDTAPRMIDTHGHVQFDAYNDDASDVINRSLEKDCWIVVPGSQMKTSQRAVEIANQYDSGVFAAVGFHPTHVDGHNGDVLDARELSRLAQDARVVAVGECGLDYYRIDASRLDEMKRLQKELFEQHMDVATENDLPMIVHCRDAYDDLLEVLRTAIKKGKIPKRGVIHCYLSDMQHAQQFLDLGFLISFTGIITFTDDEALLEAVRNVPLDKFMIETDAPYLTPVPHRGKRNEPHYVEHTAAKIAELRGIELNDVLAATTKTARTFFGI